VVVSDKDPVQAMTAGIVGGLSRVYVPFGWGLPFIVFGYDISQNIHVKMTILSVLCVGLASPLVCSDFDLFSKIQLVNAFLGRELGS
jgi:hypothetical protein